MAGSQDFEDDPVNASVLVSLNGELVPRNEAKVSIFDAGFVVGDGVWEGLRLHKGALLFLDTHMERLFAGAAAIDLDIGQTRAALVAEIRRTLSANAFEDGVHIRVMITRGPKRGATPWASRLSWSWPSANHRARRSPARACPSLRPRSAAHPRICLICD
jgi:branched-chain amino acid aminotransferase